MDTRKVSTDGLNLRSTPQILDDNILAPLPLAHTVEVVDGDAGDRFLKVRTVLDGQEHTGFASAKFLRKPASDARERLIEVAAAQWVRFKRGKGKEHVDPFFRFVGEFWDELDPALNLDGRNRDQFWSAAFISFITRKAGYDDFKFSKAHHTYIRDAIKKRNANEAAAPFWGFRLTEHQPALGDLVAGWRESRVTFDTLPGGFFASHTDVVVEVRDNEVRTLGGNVNHSVSLKVMGLDGNGCLRNEGQRFAVLRNNR